MAATTRRLQNWDTALRRLLHAVHNDRGTVSVTFLLTLPILVTIVSLLVQSALLANAQIGVNHAASMTARSAMTCLPDQEPQRVLDAAYWSLEPLSPQAQDGTSAEATTIYQALQQAGVSVTQTFPLRYSYAQEATTVTYPNSNDPNYYLTRKGQSIDVTVAYRFCLTVPIAKMLVWSAANDTVAGVPGRFITLQATCSVQTAHGRQAQSDANGWPN